MSNLPSTAPAPSTVIHTQLSAATLPQSAAAELSALNVPTALLVVASIQNPIPLLSETVCVKESVAD
jgi:hypothetical protein